MKVHEDPHWKKVRSDNVDKRVMRLIGSMDDEEKHNALCLLLFHFWLFHGDAHGATWQELLCGAKEYITIQLIKILQ